MPANSTSRLAYFFIKLFLLPLAVGISVLAVWPEEQQAQAACSPPTSCSEAPCGDFTSCATSCKDPAVRVAAYWNTPVGNGWSLGVGTGAGGFSWQSIGPGQLNKEFLGVAPRSSYPLRMLDENGTTVLTGSIEGPDCGPSYSNTYSNSYSNSYSNAYSNTYGSNYANYANTVSTDWSLTVRARNLTAGTVLDGNSGANRGILMDYTFGSSSGTNRTQFGETRKSTFNATIIAPAEDSSRNLKFIEWSGCDSTTNGGLTCRVASNDPGGGSERVIALYEEDSKPDLNVTSFRLSNTTPGTNETVTAYVNITNVGSVAAGSFLVDVYMNEPSDFPDCTSANPPAGEDAERVTSLAPGVSTGEIAFTFTTPSFFLSGFPNRTARVFIDSNCEVTESNEANNQATRNYTLTNPAPGFTLNVVPSSVTIPKGGTATYVVTAVPRGGFSGNITLSTNLTGTGISKFFSPTTIGPSGTSTMTVVTNSATGLGTYNLGTGSFLITGTSGALTANTNAVLVVTAAPDEPWVKTTDGNVGSLSGIDMLIGTPPSGQNNAEYVVIANAAVTNFNSLRGWVLGSYSSLEISVPYRYQDLVSEFSSGACPLGTGNTPTANGKFLAAGDFSTGAVTGGSTCTSSTKNGTVVFVPGRLTITGNLVSASKPITFIVGGSIEIAAGVDRVDAILIADGGFTDEVASSKLTINGALMAALDGGSAFNLLRDRGATNSTEPSEEINFNPSMYYLLSDYVGESRTFYQEERP